MLTRPRVALTLLAALFLLALPTSASAAVLYEVNSTGDQPDANPGVNGCETSVGSCTLRAAIEEADESTGEDTISFNTTVFQGQLADTIEIASALPTIDDPVVIDGTPSGQCTTEATDLGPCAGVEMTGSGFALVVEADNVTIEGLSVTGALTGIDVINASTGFTAQGDWVGVNLDAEVVANNTGIFLDPGSDEATIGGTEDAERNVISGNNNEGLDLEGASQAKILGNYVGVLPDGTTGAGNAKGIEITNSTAGLGTQAVGNEIGVTLTGEQAATPPCNAGCNVIANSFSYGIDLNGNGSGANEAPATGPTTIHGNFIGLDAPGSAALANNLWGVFVGNADEVTVGGTEFGDENRITGGEIGIVAGVGNTDAAADLTIRGNSIGVGAAGTALLPPNEGIFVSQEGIGSANVKAFIADNVIRNTGVGITQQSFGSLIAGNTITEAGTGIRTYGSISIEGSSITGNLIARSAHNGVLLENGVNTVSGNEVLESAEAGIRLQPTDPLTLGGNVIGSDEEAQENLISKNAGAAIEIEGPESTEDEIARNYGSENGGKFIDLVAVEFEPNGPNGGVKPPFVTKATQTGAEGIGAQAGAKVRVFRKATTEAGELESFLAETTADGLGNWSVTFPASIPAGALVTATQTNLAGGTSELFMPPVAAESTGGGGGEEEGGGGSGGGGGTGGGGGGNAPITGCLVSSGSSCSPLPPAPRRAPDTKITKGPPAKTHKTTVKFKFTATEAGSTFQCKLDRKPFKPCASPKKYKKLKPGKHVFKVRAVGRTGLVDATPAKRKFTVLR